MCVCVCVCLYLHVSSCVSYPAYKSHIFCATLYCFLLLVWFYQIFHIVS